MHSTAVMAVAAKRRMIELHEIGKMKAAQIAEAFGISEKTFFKCKRRFRMEGDAGQPNKSTAPNHRPQKASLELGLLVVEARKREPKSPLYPATLPELKEKVSVHGIHRTLVRHGFNRLNTPSKIVALRNEAPRPWELVRLDVKYLSTIQGKKGREYEFTAINNRTREVLVAIYLSKTTRTRSTSSCRSPSVPPCPFEPCSRTTARNSSLAYSGRLSPSWIQAQADSTISPTNKRKGRAFPPHCGRRVLPASPFHRFVDSEKDLEQFLDLLQRAQDTRGAEIKEIKRDLYRSWRRIVS